MLKSFIGHGGIALVLAACGKQAVEPSKSPAAPPAPATAAAPDPYAGVDLPTVLTSIAEVPTGTAVLTTKSAILVDGKPIVAITNGAVDPAEVEGGAGGLRISKLATALADHHDPVVVLALDATTPYKVLASEIFTAKAATSKFALVANPRDSRAHTALFVTLRDAHRDALGPPPPPTPGGAKPARAEPATTPLRLVILASKTKVGLASLSGAEGTLQHPKVEIPISDSDVATKLRAAVDEIAHRRFAGHVPDDERSLVFMVDADVPASSFLPSMVAAQSVFPDLQLSAPFE